MLKAIETQYNGRLFRSRLEARWAVFFDSLGVNYEYEHDGFELAHGDWYLPDFWIPISDFYIEIKPKGYKELDLDGYVDTLIKNAKMVGSQQSEFALRSSFVLFGNPWPEEYELVGYIKGDPIDDAQFVRKLIFAECRRCDGLCYYIVDNEANELGWGNIGNHTCDDHDRWPLLEGSQIQAAYKAARSARFEHGYSGGALL